MTHRRIALAAITIQSIVGVVASVALAAMHGPSSVRYDALGYFVYFVLPIVLLVSIGVGVVTILRFRHQREAIPVIMLLGWLVVVLADGELAGSLLIMQAVASTVFVLLSHRYK